MRGEKYVISRAVGPLFTYKAVAYRDDRYWSLYDPKVEYRIGKRLVQAVKADHQGGFYSFASVNTLLYILDDGRLIDRSRLRAVRQIAILECEISGRQIVYDGLKIASTYLKPRRVLGYLKPVPIGASTMEPMEVVWRSV